MRVFLTGASGFIGAHVMRALLANSHFVVALVMPGDSMWRLKDERGQFGVVTGSLGDSDLLRSSLREFKPDVCIHLAWYAEPGKYLYATENLSSLNDSLGLLRELILVGCRQVVMAGTCAEYDTEMGFLREDGATRPSTLYAAAKLSCCLLGQQIAAAEGINLAWGRIFYPYGPQEDQRRVVPATILSLLHGRSFSATLGQQVRDYIHVEDVATAFCVLAERRANGIYNISSGSPATIRQLLETIGILMGRSDLLEFGTQPYRRWEPPFICGDNRRLRELGWDSAYPLGEGLKRTIKWWTEENTEE